VEASFIQREKLSLANLPLKQAIVPALSEGEKKPRSELTGRRSDPFAQLGNLQEIQFRDFLPVAGDILFPMVICGEDVADFFFDSQIFVAGLVGELEQRLEVIAGGAQLLANSHPRRIFMMAAREVVACDCSIPETRPELFEAASFRQQQPSVSVENHDQKSAVPDAFPLMAFIFMFESNLPAILIDSDEEIQGDFTAWRRQRFIHLLLGLFHRKSALIYIGEARMCQAAADFLPRF
jgi:hypothetical protein